MRASTPRLRPARVHLAEPRYGTAMADEIASAGRRQLASELYDLRCEIALAEHGERFYRRGRLDEMHRRVVELEPLVGADLDALLASEDA